MYKRIRGTIIGQFCTNEEAPAVWSLYLVRRSMRRVNRGFAKLNDLAFGGPAGPPSFAVLKAMAPGLASEQKELQVEEGRVKLQLRKARRKVLEKNISRWKLILAC